MNSKEKMEISQTMSEDLVSNLLLGIGLVGYFFLRDICKRISHSDCRYEKETGLRFKLPTWREQEEPENIV